MPKMFNTLLLDAGLKLSDVRLLRHKDKRAAQERTPYDLWYENRPLFDVFQSTQEIYNRSRLSVPC